MVAFSLLYIPAYASLTMVRGALIDWYPYPFLEAGTLGYGRVLTNLLVISLGFAALAAGYHLLDLWFGNRAAAVPSPVAAT